MLHWSAIYNVVERKDSTGMPVEFSLVFVKKSTGDIVNAERVVCTSSHFRPRSINIMFVVSREIRKVRCVSIIEINGVEVYI